MDVGGLGEGRQRLPPRVLLLAGRCPALNQAENNHQDKKAVGAQGPSPLVPIGIFPARRQSVKIRASLPINPSADKAHRAADRVLDLPQAESLRSLPKGAPAYPGVPGRGPISSGIANVLED